MKLATLLAATLLATGASAQTFTDPANLRGERPRPSDGRELPVDQGSKGLQQLLRKLNTRASLMLIVAHPDDEDGGMLTLYSRGLGARVAMLTLNRGEGGQNAMTGDFEDALGLLRTQELLAADRYFNVDQMFGTEVDFGFSKTKEEAFAKWTHERVFYDAVRAVRIYRPLVIAAVFIGGVTDGHGQHQVSGQIAQEVFNAAGDPKVFPELTAEGILPWQPLKVYARVPMQSISAQGLFDYATGQYTPARFTNYVTGEVTTTQPSVDVVVHEGTPDPLLDGKSYVQFARMGLGLQRSQIGAGVRNAPAGAFDVSYHLYGSKLSPSQTLSSRPKRSAVERPAAPPTPANGSPFSNPDLDPGFFEGIDTSILSLQQYRTFPTDLVPKLAGSIDYAVKNFDPTQPQTIAPALADALRTVDDLIRFTEQSKADAVEQANSLHELRIKRVQLNDALALSLGVTFQVTLNLGNAKAPDIAPIVLPQRVDTAWHVRKQSDAPVTLIGFGTGDAPTAGGNFNAKVLDHTFDLNVSLNMSSDKLSAGQLGDKQYFTRPNIEQPYYDLRTPELRNAPSKSASIAMTAFLRFRDVQFTVTALSSPRLADVPAVSVTLSNHAIAAPAGKASVPVAIHLQNSQAVPTTGEVRIVMPDGWSSEPASATFSLDNANSTKDLTFQITPKKRSIGDSVLLRAEVKVGSQTFSEGYRPIGYGDLPRTNFFTPATVRIVPVDLKLPTRTRIAYLPGTGDSIPDALTAINLKPTILTLSDLTAANLAQYDTIILGVRTYNAHPELHGTPTQALFDYARNGGNVIVQFQTGEFTAADAPYPLTLGRAELVSDETAPVQLVEPTSPLLTTPNKITPADFNNWVEERGHGFLRTWDPHYTALTETHDPGQAPQLGGLITTQLGKGHWTYSAFALYRQLPEAIPGAYRLFANLLNP